MVILTALLCLGVAGYAGQVWWARRMAGHCRLIYSEYGHAMDIAGRWYWIPRAGGCYEDGKPFNHPGYGGYWKTIPSYGLFYGGSWFPRRTFYEAIKLNTTIDLGNDPDAWQAHLGAHPYSMEGPDGKLRFYVSIEDCERVGIGRLTR